MENQVKDLTNMDVTNGGLFFFGSLLSDESVAWITVASGADEEAVFEQIDEQTKILQSHLGCVGEVVKNDCFGSFAEIHGSQALDIRGNFVKPEVTTVYVVEGADPIPNIIADYLVVRGIKVVKVPQDV